VALLPAAPAAGSWRWKGKQTNAQGGDLSNAIEIRLDDISQLFETKDPVPFRERDLATDADAYISGHASELPRDQPLELVVHLPSEAANLEGVRSLDKSVSNFFALRAAAVARELGELFRVGRRSLAVGLAVLAACLLAGQVLSALTPRGGVAHFIEEGFIIVGWVALWRPLEIFLYDWWPLAQKRRLYQRLSEAQVAVRFYDKANRL
jgi:hypothetical protein